MDTTHLSADNGEGHMHLCCFLFFRQTIVINNTRHILHCGNIPSSLESPDLQKTLSSPVQPNTPRFGLLPYHRCSIHCPRTLLPGSLLQVFFITGVVSSDDFIILTILSANFFSSLDGTAYTGDPHSIVNKWIRTRALLNMTLTMASK